jgi:aryl-alcohol dehydrogenase-like predicted oxidoreductase
MIGLGCMRLSTVEPRDDARSIAVIHAALDAGATLLDTADVYCLDDTDLGHNERLVAQALKTWAGDASRITVATKGGLARPGGRWVNNARAKHLHSACEASLRALDVPAIDLYQLHAVDPRVPLETSVRALAELQKAGLIRRVGLSNVNVSQIKAAQKIVDVASVQVSLSVLDDENLRNGVFQYCRDNNIQLIAHRPLGGTRIKRIARDPTAAGIAAQYGVTPCEAALAWLLALAPNVVPIPGATRVDTARSIARVVALELKDVQVPTAPAPKAASREGEVVMVMGMPAAGKSSAAEEFVARGYQRLNRDTVGGTLADLVPELDAGLAEGATRWVLDNTYASRKARNQVIECAARHGVAVRCVRLTTSLADAQINAVCRLIGAFGKLPLPEDFRKLGKTDHRFFGPDAQFRYERQLEEPVLDEGFSAIEERPFERRPFEGFDQRAIIADFDALDLVERYRRPGDKVLAIAWLPGGIDAEVRAALGDVELEYCPHPAGPPVCWCRKPLPGLILQFAFRYRLDLSQCIYLGRKRADQTLAERLGMRQLSGADLRA